MAVVNSLNSQCPFITLLTKPKNPNFNSLKFNPNQASRICFPSRRCVLVNGTLQNSHRNTPEEDDEVDNLGVKAALSMLKFSKGKYRLVAGLFPRVVSTQWKHTRNGVVKGTVLTAWRLCRCNPLGGSGFDPPRWFDEEKPTEE
ncbi:UPF0161 protein [Gossypium australe]|uniref:UPF0161 protein n=1 Tax=Gossypium australe TaxID=47621 RepID=A0A5B6UTC9_9ROSI|nr:UPF0161 protein [Gossypium australe]